MYMKKVLFCLVFVGMFHNISAQEMQKNEVYAGLGLLNDNQMIAMLADVVGTIFTGGYLVQPGTYRAFTPFIGFRYGFTNRFSLGGIFAFDVNSVKVFNGETSDKQMREINRYYMTYAIEPKFNYIAKPAFQLYGYLGFGATVVTFGKAIFDNGSEAEISRVPYFNMHVTPLGVRFGKEFGGFVEFGYGYKGILNGGLSYRF